MEVNLVAARALFDTEPGPKPEDIAAHIASVQGVGRALADEVERLRADLDAERPPPK